MSMQDLKSGNKVWWFVALAAVGLMAGCGKAKQPWEQVYPAKGVVNYKGKPLAGALITLIPQDSEYPEQVRPTATSNENGEFELGTFSKTDGAPVGEYKAIVLHYPVIGKPESPSAGPNDLPKKYARAETTDLVVEVSAGTNDLLALDLN